MDSISAAEKYSQPDVVSCWQNLSQQGLQQAEWFMVNRYFKPGQTVLDVGCGAGRAVLALNKAGYTMTGIDLSLPMLKAGRTLSPPARLGGANLLNLPFAGESFEASLMFFGALQHIPGRGNRQQALTEMARVTQSGGVLILGLDNLAPALICYLYWGIEKIHRRHATAQPSPTTTADQTLWSRQTRRVNPLVWHSRGVARTLRWRTWPGLVDALRRSGLYSGQSESGDTSVAQFSLQTTAGKTYYHIYRAKELIADAAVAGWQLLGQFSGSELQQAKKYPPAISRRDKLLFFAFTRTD